MFKDIKRLLQASIDAGTPFDDALADVERMVIESSKSTQLVIREAVSIASRYVCRRTASDQRGRIFRAAAILSSARAAGTAALHDKAARLLEFRLPGGKPIAECTGIECSEASDFYLALSRTNAIRAAWLKRVAARAGSHVVGKILTESDLQSIYNEMEQS